MRIVVTSFLRPDLLAGVMKMSWFGFLIILKNPALSSKENVPLVRDSDSSTKLLTNAAVVGMVGQIATVVLSKPTKSKRPIH